MVERLFGDSEALTAVWQFLTWGWPYLFTVLYFGTAVAASAHVVLFKRDVRSAVAWAGLIWLSPFLGAALYTMFGINRIHRRATRLRGDEPGEGDFLPEGARMPVVRPHIAPEMEALAAGIERDRAAATVPPPPLAGLRRFVRTVSGRGLTGNNRVTPLVNGDEGYPAMLEAIEGAERSVALCTFIFEYDRSGKRFVEALRAVTERGVAVRVLIDGVGKRYSRPHAPGVLAANGIPVAEFLRHVIPLRNPYLNLRNHRKILVVDGRVGFTGGLNIREHCELALDPPYPTQDLHFRFEGPVVRHLMEEFAHDWHFTTEEELEGWTWFPPLAGVGTVEARGIADGPDENFEAIQWVLLGALAAAERRVRIVTPYFLPDQTLIAALNLAAMRGVSVQIVLPEKSNLRFVQWAATAQLWQVLVNGCEIFQSPAPFDHSKMMVVDDTWVFVGSANWDARSLRLNFELNVECYDAALAARVGELIDVKMAGCRRLTLDEVNARPLPIKLRDGIARLFSPYL
jgi:cardiolipin synthase